MPQLAPGPLLNGSGSYKWCRTHLKLQRKLSQGCFVANSWFKAKTKMPNGCVTDSKPTYVGKAKQTKFILKLCKDCVRRGLGAKFAQSNAVTRSSTNITEWPEAWSTMLKTIQNDRGPGRSLSQAPPGGRLGPGSGPKSTISGPPPKKNLKALLTAMELFCRLPARTRHDCLEILCRTEVSGMPRGGSS